MREIALAPGDGRAYDEEDWRDALVVVERGEIELESRGGRRRRFESGAILWFSGLSLRALHNRGREPAVLVAISRRPEPRTGGNVGKTAPTPGSSRATVSGAGPSSPTDEFRRPRRSM